MMPGNSNYGRPQGAGCCMNAAVLMMIAASCMLWVVLKLIGAY